MTTTDCQLIEGDDDNIVPTIEDEDCQEMETDVIRDNVNERVIPSDSFFASGIGSIITSYIVSINVYIKMITLTTYILQQDEGRLRESLQTAVQVLHSNNKVYILVIIMPALFPSLLTLSLSLSLSLSSVKILQCYGYSTKY